MTAHPAPQTASSGSERTLLALCAALTLLAIAAVANAFGLPPAIAAAPAVIAVALLALAVVSASRSSALTAAATTGETPNASSESKTPPIAVTTTDGTSLTVNAAFANAMAARHRQPHADALAPDASSAATLFALRREALTSGPAHGVLADGTLLTVRRSGNHLIHTIDEPAATPVPPTHATTLVDAIPAPAAIITPEGDIRAANTAFSEALGDTATLTSALAVEKTALSRLDAQAKTRPPARLDAPLAATPERRVRLTAKPFTDGTLIVVLTDVTAQSDLEAHIAQSQKMQAIGQLAGGIAHDFNNVLTAIIGFSDLLLQNHRPSDPAFRDIMNIKQSAQRAAGLVKQLLAFSRRQTLRPTVINLNDVVADLSIMLDRLLGEPVRLDISYGRDLWPVLADLSQIEQVVINLAVNARDAMPGGGKLTIRTANVEAGTATLTEDNAVPGDAVLIEVTDVGSGMPQHVLDKIFEPFFTTKATGAGTGLGLSTVYGIVKQTGGALDVSSQEGAGTTFRVYLPRTESLAPAAEPEATAAGPADLTGNATLLLVEDEEAIRTIAARALTAKGYTVLSAATGVEAAEIFEERGDDVDLLLTDVIMPELDGPGLVKIIRGTRPDLKIIFMSGYADGASVDDLGGARFLPKPFTLKALAEAVTKELAA